MGCPTARNLLFGAMGLGVTRLPLSKLSLRFYRVYMAVESWLWFWLMSSREWNEELWITIMEPVAIFVSYVDLLEKIANVLGFNSPVYAAIQTPDNRSYVRVSSKSDFLSYVFDDDVFDTFHRSCEDAAKKAIMYFVRNRNVCIHDVNFEKVAQLRKCRALYALKCHELDCIEKGNVMRPSNVALGESNHSPAKNCVYLDFMQLLRAIITEAQVHVTPIECIRYGDEDFQAWFSVPELGAVRGTHCIIGDRATSIDEAKQLLAQKTSLMLVAHCGIIVDDISSYLVTNEEVALKATREAYIACKERVCGLHEKMSPTPTIIEQDQLTPRGKRFAISTPNAPPLPPKKRKANRELSLEATIPHSVVVDALDALFAEARRA